jgi:hypothetical protein
LVLNNTYFEVYASIEGRVRNGPVFFYLTLAVDILNGKRTLSDSRLWQDILIARYSMIMDIVTPNTGYNYNITS